MRKSTGDMYEWVDEMHTHIHGACPHACAYCYSRRCRARRFYEGPLRLSPSALKVRYGEGKTIFLEHMTDLFAEDMPYAFIRAVVDHANRWPNNTYVFQTKNPWGLVLNHWDMVLPPRRIIGCTIETNRRYPQMGNAPDPVSRAVAMSKIGGRKFITIEPIMEFDEAELVGLIRKANPDWVNIGADSKRCKLPEPSRDAVYFLIYALASAGIEVRLKPNLKRLGVCTD